MLLDRIDEGKFVAVRTLGFETGHASVYDAGRLECKWV